MKGKRTGVEFENHEVIVSGEGSTLIHHLKIPDTRTNSIKFINTNGIMAVTGDYGNWIFSREFHPNANNYVDDSYWCGKLKIASCQEPYDFDAEETKKQLIEKLKEYREQHEDLLNQDVLDYYEKCIEKTEENELYYTYFAYTEKPSALEYDNVIFVQDYKIWLKIIFDGFDEICRRLSLDVPAAETSDTNIL